MNGLPSAVPELALALALAWGAGIRVYAVLFLCGLAGRMAWIDLPGHLSLLSHPLVLGASGFMLVVEFLADKVPWIDSIWDAVHTFIRIPVGAALVTMLFSDGSAAVSAAAAILGGAVAAGAHFAKAGARSSINLSPEPFSNWAASLTEDALVPTGLWLAVAHPAAFLVLLVAATVAALLMLRWIWGGLRAIVGRLR
ncbi:MAG: hypothetical protein AW08_00394 [Candidatus Accumulibacter adjunctus]|uniref:DUF4126 domain-containing protein n=1 Tax=Candidatus Accumulibacter adjunctus TaxID=1454001 RepID=A0A011NX13_9PROT|nr:MAG: hypothetical protein AW08_00394 [Candidatus Accumulibacter adjunctus]